MKWRKNTHVVVTAAALRLLMGLHTRSQARVQELEFLDAAVSSVSAVGSDGAKGEPIPGGLRDQVHATVYPGFIYAACVSSRGTVVFYPSTSSASK